MCVAQSEVATSAAISSKRLSDDLALCVGRCGFDELGHCAVLLGVEVFITRNSRWIAAISCYTESMKAEILHFPARLLTPDERALVAE